MTETPTRWKLVEVPSRAAHVNMAGGETPGISSMGRSPSVSRGTNRPQAAFVSGAVGDQVSR